MAVHGDGEHALGLFLADHVLVELRHDLARRGDAREELLARAAAFAFLVEDRLAKLDALAADVDVARSFDQRADVAIALATERTERVLFGGSAAACAADIPARGHRKLLPGRRRFARTHRANRLSPVDPKVSLARWRTSCRPSTPSGGSRPYHSASRHRSRPFAPLRSPQPSYARSCDPEELPCPQLLVCSRGEHSPRHIRIYANHYVELAVLVRPIACTSSAVTLVGCFVTTAPAGLPGAGRLLRS